MEADFEEKLAGCIREYLSSGSDTKSAVCVLQGMMLQYGPSEPKGILLREVADQIVNWIESEEYSNGHE